MLIGLGLDICRVDRIAAALQRHGGRFSHRILAAPELVEFEALATGQQAGFLAKRFVAKEAFSKALGTGIGRGFGFTDVWVTHCELGAPRLQVSAVVAQLLANRGADHHWISLTDETDLAAAVCVLESK